MSFTLQVNFQGMCAFVPQKDGARAWAFLVNEVDADNDRVRKNLHRHLPRVRYSLGDLVVPRADSESDTPISRTIDQVSGADRSSCFLRLDFSDLFILPGGRQEFRKKNKLQIKGFSANAVDIDLPIPETSTETGSFANLGCLERACLGRGCRPGGGELNPDLLSPMLETFNDILAARVNLTYGDLSTGSLGGDPNRQAVVVWRFKPYKSKDSVHDHRQVLASTVILEMKIEYDFVRFEAVDLRTGKTQAYVDLAGPPDKKIFVDVFNEEAEQYFPRKNALSSKARKIKVGKARKGDRILESYYRLARNAPPLDQRSIPIADYFIFTGGGADSSPPCSPVRMLSVPKPSE